MTIVMPRTKLSCDEGDFNPLKLITLHLLLETRKGADISGNREWKI